MLLRKETVGAWVLCRRISVPARSHALHGFGLT